MPRAFRLAFFSIALTALVAGVGCGDDDDPVVPPPPRSTPQGLLDQFATSTETATADLAFHAECLHPHFRFYFAEEDRAGDPTLPEYWTRDEYLAAVENMFTMALFVTMDMAITDTLSEGPCSGDPGAPVCRTYETQLDLAVTVHQEPENLTFLVDGFANMTAVEELPGSGQYVVHRAVDRTSVSSGGGT